jgi:hypothetical protein
MKILLAPLSARFCSAMAYHLRFSGYPPNASTSEAPKTTHTSSLAHNAA